MNSCLSYIKCGNVYKADLPDNLKKSEPPIVIADVKVNTECIDNPTVFVKFSQFISFEILGLNPNINIIYRLVRKDLCTYDEQILQEWEFEFSSINTLEVANISTSQPTVLTCCDCLDGCISNRLVYRLEIVQIETNNVKIFGLTNESLTATITKGLCRCNQSNLPYTKCGEVFNPVLPLSLKKYNKPIELTQVTVDINRNTETCLLINFSSFVTSVLKEERFNNLTLRLVKVYDDCTVETLREWPFRRVFVNDTNIKEPLVYDYCECVYSKFDMCFTYAMQLVEADLSKDSYYEITNKGMTAQVYHGTDNHELC